MSQRNLWYGLSILVLVVIPVFLWLGQNTHTETPAKVDTPEVVAKPWSDIGTYATTQESQKIRVTVLGITKGVAFLASEDLVGGEERPHGNYTVPWLRVDVLAERLTDNPFGLVVCKLQTADGRDLVETMKVQWHGFPITSQASGTAWIDLNLPHLSSTIFPVAAPKVDNPDRSMVFTFTVSGQFRKTDQANLILGFGEATNREEFVFKDVPIP